MRKEYKQMMDQLSPREELVEQVLAQAGAHAEPRQKRRRPMHKKKLILALAAVLVVLTGSAMAVGSQLGLLNVFFQGDTSGLEPYVQTEVGSAENEDFRFTVNSAYYDGRTVYAMVTLEGLNDKAVADLQSNQVVANHYIEIWGQDKWETLLERDGNWLEDSAWLEMFISNASSFNSSSSTAREFELPAPTDESRSWVLDYNFDQWVGPTEKPLQIWVDFMGEDCVVEIPLDKVVTTVRLEPNYTICMDVPTQELAIVQEIVVTPTQIYYQMQYLTASRAVQLEAITGDWFALRMKDGTILKQNQMDAWGTVDWSETDRICNSFTTLNSLVYSDVSEVYSIILGDTEFPLDGSQPFPSELVLDLSHQQKAS